MTIQINRLLITGAAGALGSVLRQHYAGRFPALRLSDRSPLGDAGPDEELVTCELGDAEAVDRLFEGVDACVHLGGQPVEAPWPVIMNANIVGAVNTWEAARKAGTKRIVFASSNHAIGFHPRTKKLDHRSPARPDTRYGLSKAFGEDLAVYYANKHGISAMCMRIGSCREEPVDERGLSTWQSYPDFCRLVDVGLTADYAFEIVYGVSNNPRSWWDNSNAERLGYRPQDSAEGWADRVKGKVSPEPINEMFQGGTFCAPDFSGDVNRIV
jgi:uronate dehydrogenase